MDLAEHVTCLPAALGVDVSGKHLLLPRRCAGGSVAHREGEVLTIFPEHTGNDLLRQDLRQNPHDLELAKDPANVAEPGVARAKLGSRLFEHEAALVRLNAE